MSSGGTLRKIVGGGGLISENPLGKSNALRQIVDPMGIARQNYAEGGSNSPQDVLDPGGVFTKTSLQQKAQAESDAYEAAAPDRAAAAATDTANQALIASKRRRQSGLGSLATGAVSGGAALSSTATYGKSTLGA